MLGALAAAASPPPTLSAPTTARAADLFRRLPLFHVIDASTALTLAIHISSSCAATLSLCDHCCFWAKMPQLQRRASIHIVTYVWRWRQQCAMVKEAERAAGGRPLDAVVPDEPAAEEK